MLTPTVANRISWLYAAGNTPAINLARCIPHGQDANVLSLGCGDLRSILYTSYIEDGLPARKLDITSCDYDEKIIGRNIVLLTLIIDDDETIAQESLWNIYYHLYLDDPTTTAVRQHAQKLIPLLESLDTWKASPYGSTLRICDEDTLGDIQKVCQRIVDAAERRNHDTHLSSFSESLLISKEYVGGDNTIITGLRSAAPLSMKSQSVVPANFKYYWAKGTVMAEADETPKVPNPMFAGLVSKNEILHYGTDPLLGFHLATAFAHLTENSPLKPEETAESYKIATAAKAQFSEWVRAFRSLMEHIVLRFVVSDVFAFCHTLQFAAASGTVSANWYRRQWSSRILHLDETTYGDGSNGPLTFDAIHTSNLSDHVGALNIAVSAVALLKERPWATLYTEQLIKRDKSEQQAFDNILCGPSSTVSLLLGLTSLQYWTNAKSESHVDEVFLGLVAGVSGSRETQLHSRLAWKRDGHFTGDGAERPKLHIEAKAVARAIFQIYLKMFKTERLPTNRASAEELLKGTSTYGHFHRGSFVALLKMIKSRVKTDWPVMIRTLLDSISLDQTLVLASNQIQDLGIQLHLSGVHTEGWVLNLGTTPDEGPFKGWRNLPPAVAVTVAIPRNKFDRLFNDSKQSRMASPTLVGSLRASVAAPQQWHNMFGDVHVVFGKVKTTRNPETGDVVVSVTEDEQGWSGSSPLIVTFTVPTAALLVEPKTTLVGVCVPPTGMNSAIYGPVLGMSMTVFETKITDESKVFVSRLMMGQSGDKAICGGVKPFEDQVDKADGEGPTKFLAEISSEGKITTLTGHIDISSEKGRGLLRDKIPIELRQQNPFVIDVVFGKNKLVCPLRYPVPVTKEGSKTRIARTSGYIEVIAPLAVPTTSDVLADFISPTTVTSQGLPVALNTPHIHLDNLPIVDLSKKVDMRWLVTLTSFQFSSRERRLREVSDKNTGISNDPRVNFKESLFTMFMLSSGLQGGQTGMFAITHPERGGIHMLIFISALRLDGDTASVVLDAAVIPFTTRLIESGKMEAFLLLIRTLECCTLRVNDAELLLWKKVLPSLVERCRTWNHLASCEYKRKGATAPISLDLGEKVLCSCGNGHLPDDFVTVPEWETAAQNAVRVAISPIYAVPFVEDVVDKSVIDAMKGPLADAPRCRNCGKKEEDDGPKLKKCMRCQKAKYCSAECQRTDWKKHRMECE